MRIPSCFCHTSLGRLWILSSRVAMHLLSLCLKVEPLPCLLRWVYRKFPSGFLVCALLSSVSWTSYVTRTGYEAEYLWNPFTVRQKGPRLAFLGLPFKEIPPPKLLSLCCPIFNFTTPPSLWSISGANSDRYQLRHPVKGGDREH